MMDHNSTPPAGFTEAQWAAMRRCGITRSDWEAHLVREAGASRRCPAHAVATMALIVLTLAVALAYCLVTI